MEKNKKQTAVEWLEKEIYSISLEVFDGFLTFNEFMEQREKLFEQAKEMEKQQIKIAYKSHHDLEHIYGLDSEQYYKETYGHD